MPNPYHNQTIAVFGASQDSTKYGYKIFHTLLQKGFNVYGINPKGGQIDGHSFFAHLADVPIPVNVAIMVIPPAGLLGAVEQCAQKHVKEIWFQPGAQSEEAFTATTRARIRAINACFMAENNLW